LLAPAGADVEEAMSPADTARAGTMGFEVGLRKFWWRPVGVRVEGVRWYKLRDRPCRFASTCNSGRWEVFDGHTLKMRRRGSLER